MWRSLWTNSSSHGVWIQACLESRGKARNTANSSSTCNDQHHVVIAFRIDIPAEVSAVAPIITNPLPHCARRPGPIRGESDILKLTAGNAILDLLFQPVQLQPFVNTAHKLWHGVDHAFTGRVNCFPTASGRPWRSRLALGLCCRFTWVGIWCSWPLSACLLCLPTLIACFGPLVGFGPLLLDLSLVGALLRLALGDDFRCLSSIKVQPALSPESAGRYLNGWNGDILWDILLNISTLWVFWIMISMVNPGSFGGTTSLSTTTATASPLAFSRGLQSKLITTCDHLEQVVAQTLVV